MLKRSRNLKRARSFLFVPGDSERKIAKAAQVAADALIYDLEDAVAAARKGQARKMVAAALSESRGEEGVLRLVRINPINTPEALADLCAVMPSAPDLIMQPKISAAGDIRTLDCYLSALEAREGLPVGCTGIIPLVTETPEMLFELGRIKGVSARLAALTWGAEDLAAALGASANQDSDGRWTEPFQLARSGCLLAARAADVLAVDTLFVDFRDSEGLRKACDQARIDGFDSKLAIHPDQVDVINASFSPSAEEAHWAQAVVELFAANPEAASLSLDGKMLDVPHRKQAERILARRRNL